MAKSALATPILKLRRLGKNLNELQLALLRDFPQALVEHSHSLCIIVVLTILLIMSQERFLWACPELIVFSAPIALFLDLLFLYIDILSSIIGAAFDVILLIIKAIPGVHTSLKPLPVWPFTTSQWVLALPSAAAVKARLVELHRECGGPGFFDAYTILNYAFAQINGNKVCHFVRYLYPVPWLYNLFNGLLGWLFVGSPEPVAGPTNGVENCGLAAENKFTVLPEPACIALASGWILAEVVVPFYFGIIFFGKVARPLWNVTTDVVLYTLQAIKAIIFP